MKPLYILFIVCIIDVLGFGVLIPLVPYMGVRFGASPGVITAILGSYSLCQLLAAPLWGRLSDRYGRRPILTSSLAGACLSYVILGLAHGLFMLLLARMLAGAMAGNLAAAFAYASDVSAPEDRAKSMGVVGAAIGLGFTLGMPIGGVLAGDDPQTANFLRPALVSAALSILAILLVRMLLPESRAEHKQANVRGSRPLQLLAQRPALRAIAAAALLVTCTQGMLESIFALWALNRFGFGPRSASYALFVVAIAAVLTQGGLVRVLAPRLGERLLGAFGACVYTLGLVAVVAAGSSLLLVAAGLLLCGFGSGAFIPSASALASKQSTGADRGAVMGTYQASTSLARVIGPFASGWIYQGLGASAPFLVGACITLPAAWLLWRATAPSPSQISTPPAR
jgi:DHA1 family tetracycline resistance protein-like MFS transporter